MENGFASAWKLGLHGDIDYFQNPVFGDAFWGNGLSLFGIITYVPTSALVTSSKIPLNQSPKILLLGGPFPIWEECTEATWAGPRFGKRCLGYL